MMKKKYKKILNKCCFWIIPLIIVSGCSGKTKRDQLLKLQRVRIQKLERHLQAKENLIENLKAQRWVRSPVQKPVALELKALKGLIRKKDWVGALKLSGKLKKDYPRSIPLAKYRASIFKKMGLRKQARAEIRRAKRWRAQSRGSNRIR